MRVYIITSAKFEECYIEEWVKYHLNIGFDKIIINDNNPKNYPYNPKDILKKYIDDGTVVIERYYDEHNKENFDEITMPKIYFWLYNKYKDEFDWFAKLDIDEYLDIHETNNNIKQFLAQDKFNNALSIVIPWTNYGVKDEYLYTYTRLKNNRDRFNKTINFIYNSVYQFKSIIKKSNYLVNIQLHFADFINTNDNIIQYILPDGQDASIKLLIGTPLNDNIQNAEVNKNNDYIHNLLNIATIKHYCYTSTEEQVNHMIKFEAKTYKNFCLHDLYIGLYNEYKDMFEHPRDLYKLYFIDNINNIQED